MKALVIGGSSWDTLIHVNQIKELKDDMMLLAEKTNESVGGTGAGKSFCLDALGVETTLITELGRDIQRERIVSFFNQTKIKLIDIEVDKTVTHTNIMHAKGKRISILTGQPKIESKIHQDAEILVKEAEVVYLNINNFCRQYIPLIKKYKKLCVVDIHDYDTGNLYHQDFIDVADILTGSEINISNPQKFMEEQINLGKRLVVLTNGDRGLRALDDQSKSYNLEGYTDIEYVDSNGAGDSFCSGMVTHYLNTKDVGESLKIGAICGALACTSINLFNSNYSYIDILNIKKSVDF